MSCANLGKERVSDNHGKLNKYALGDGKMLKDGINRQLLST